MKNTSILSVILMTGIIMLSSCVKENDVQIYRGKNSNPIPDPNDNNWTYNPQEMIQAAPATFNGGSGNTANYTYYHRIPLDNFSCNPYVGSTLSTLFIPHVGPAGTTIYKNVGNDATYTIYKVENGYAYVSVRTDNVTSTGCPLEWNISIGDESDPNWALAKGNFAKLGPTYNHDDGTNNVYRIRYLNGQMYPCW